jgi:hypothetical protein
MGLWMITITRDEPDREQLYVDLAGTSDTAVIAEFVQWCEAQGIAPVDDPGTDLFGRYTSAVREAGWRILFRIVAEPRPLSPAVDVAVAAGAGASFGARRVTVEAVTTYRLDIDPNWWDEIRAGRSYDDPSFTEELADVVEACGDGVGSRKHVTDVLVQRSN